MKYRLYRVRVQGADDKGVLDDDAAVLLEVAVEVPAEFATARGPAVDEETGTNPIPLQQQIRTALEAARPGNP